VVCDNRNFFIPNTFSPNGDGSNEIFYPRGQGLFKIKSLRIFNRWGELVFENREFQANDPSAGWNGMYKGKKGSPDVYVYQIEIYCTNDQVFKLAGNVALIL
jgi:gliding motility-associated-like protein